MFPTGRQTTARSTRPWGAQAIDEGWTTAARDDAELAHRPTSVSTSPDCLHVFTRSYNRVFSAGSPSATIIIEPGGPIVNQYWRLEKGLFVGLARPHYLARGAVPGSGSRIGGVALGEEHCA